MSWRELQLSDGIHVKHGFAFKGEYFASSGEYMVLTPGNFLEKGGFRVRDGKERFYHADFPEDYLLAEGDLIVAMTEQGEGLLGSAARIPAEGKYLHNQRLGLVQVVNPELLDKRFLYWVFNSSPVRAQIRATATGAKVKHTAPERIKKVRFMAPELREQQAVAFVLDSYDDLIATNQRRIALLEDAARRLYREWFVQLRFPGHESVPLRDGVPEGWRRDTLDQALFLQRGFDLPNGNRVPGDVPVYASTGVNGYHNVAKVDGPGVVTGRSGTLGAVHYVAQDFWPLNTSLWVKEFRAVSPLVAYFMLAELGLEQFNSGASVPTLDRKVAHQIPVLIPERNVVSAFDERVQPLFHQVQILRKSNESTAQARDRLLPKLMSGQLNVSSIPLPDEVSV
ncbi:restriction endonuclease subunit S [Pseudomonas otitidis]|uniref:Restriction endonuclease subunit S n=1 Tax=Metapseudomonas otitidis TaxID=319939 RepID=A0A7X3H3F5_9GAMM|nr:restriction endonuclease subunit S [Pseudomonas otitidis]MWK54653.1 restriction endonuclease subunit S [Pseudomonas otitidis]